MQFPGRGECLEKKQCSTMLPAPKWGIRAQREVTNGLGKMDIIDDFDTEQSLWFGRVGSSRRLRLQQAMIVPLHSNMGNRAKLHLKNKTNKQTKKVALN